jgi:hypothetical protein
MREALEKRLTQDNDNGDKRRSVALLSVNA